MANTLKLGATGPTVFPLGLGCMGMSGVYGATDDAESVRAIHAALDAGMSLVDTGDFYGSGHNERLVGRAIAGRRDRVILSVKFGALRAPGGAWGGIDTRPAAVKNFLAYSLDRLGVDHIDIYRPARLDPNVPIEDTVGAIAELVKAGYVRHIGLSEVGVETLRRARKVHPIVDLQIEYSIASRSPEAKIFPALHELGISATLYSVLGRGLLTGSRPTGKGDFRQLLPRFAGDDGARNAGVVAALHEFARARGLTPAQLAVAWVRARQPSLLPVVGIKTAAQVADLVGALDHELAAAELAELERIAPASAFAGERYQPAQMQHLDSER
jgi:aryl-alcohol dehydrogenase-like predicted oxidoreductase